MDVALDASRELKKQRTEKQQLEIRIPCSNRNQVYFL